MNVEILEKLLGSPRVRFPFCKRGMMTRVFAFEAAAWLKRMNAHHAFGPYKC